MNFDTDFDDMSDEELIDAAGSLRDENAELRQKVQHLTQKLARAYYRENENTSEIARHHAALAEVSRWAEDAETELSEALGAEVLEYQWDTIDCGRSAVRKIRNIVG